MATKSSAPAMVAQRISDLATAGVGQASEVPVEAGGEVAGHGREGPESIDASDVGPIANRSKVSCFHPPRLPIMAQSPCHLPAEHRRLRHPARHGRADEIISFGFAGAGQTIPVSGDFSGTGKTDIAAYLPSIGAFAIRPDTGGPDEIIPFGFAGAGQTITAPGDYFGEGRDDIAAYLPSIGAFAIRPGNGNPDVIEPFGLAGAGRSIPATGDYDVDGKTDVAVYLPSIGAFAIRPSSGGPDEIIPFGFAGAGQSIPMTGDYDGSGRTELAVYLPSIGGIRLPAGRRRARRDRAVRLRRGGPDPAGARPV